MPKATQRKEDTPPRRYQTRSSTRSHQSQPKSSSSSISSPTATTTLTTVTSSSSSPSSAPTSSSTFTLSPIPWSLRNPPSATLKSPLLRKRTWLQNNTISLPQGLAARLRDDNALSGSGSDPVGATLVFAQQEAGTAVCVSPDGVLLTCAHCVAESANELNLSTLRVLLFASGAVVTARVVAWDPIRDLALLVIAEAEAATGNGQGEATQRPFPYISFAPRPPTLNAPLLCIGHPGSEDLETSSSKSVPTNYDTLVLSTGRFRGLAKGQDVQDNSEIGALAHTCWTYWGHSGAGLVDAKSGKLVGLHSSWDEDTGMRRGIAWEAISAFLWEMVCNGKSPEGWRWCMN
ncbi:trypsin-like cysteine/serine peptidase domain-containing protein [Mariannaea sp. PMI_226]|nr:trypsin-like cysteine/serine peptidase domain-containing protein [Mariannaea sp. PMI_226]